MNHSDMLSKLLPILALFFATAAMAQNSVDVPPVDDELQIFIESFYPEDIGFLHIYIDPSVDPLETYLLRGSEMSDAAVSLLPDDFRSMADNGVLFGAIAIMGIDENLYITRFRGEQGDQIDMFAIREGRIKHLKTLAYLRCDTPGDCPQMDAYITDLNLDTTFDLVQITRSGETDTEPEREVFTMLVEDREWVATQELEVPWEGITFYKHQSSATRDH